MKKKDFSFYAKEIGDNFCFENVHKIMMATGWVWVFGNDAKGQYRYGIPCLTTIKNMAYNLLEEAYNDGETHSTGGFTAGWEDGEMFLQFVAEEWSSAG